MKHRFLKLIAALVFAAGTFTAVHAEEAKTPIVYLPFNEIKDGKTPNLGSIYCEPIVEGGVTVVDGKFGKAVDFSGKDSKVELPLNLNEAAPYGITVSVWVKCAPIQDGYGTILSAGPGYHGLYFRVQARDTVDFSFAGAWHTITISHFPSLLKGWTHLVFTYDRKIARLFADGNLVGEKKAEYSPDYGTAVEIGKSISLEGRKDQATGATISTFYFFKGAMDNFKIFDYAMTAEQAAQLDQ